jgi:plasmid stabilization system protein ParE
VARIVWTRGALSDLLATSAAAQRWIADRVGLLSEFPLLGSATDGPYDGFRQLLVARHRVIYQVDEDEVRIAYIRHGARQLSLRLVASEARDDDGEE